VPKFKLKPQQNTTGAKNIAIGQQEMFKRTKMLRRVTLLMFKCTRRDVPKTRRDVPQKIFFDTA